MKATITLTLEVEYTCTQDARYVQRTGDYEGQDLDCWEVQVEAIQNQDPPPDLVLDWLENQPQVKAQLIAHFKDNYDPTPLE